MRTARKLVVKKEILSELTTAELESVAGGDTTGQVSAMINTCGGTTSRNISPCPTRNNVVCDRVSTMIQPCPTRDFC